MTDATRVLARESLALEPRPQNVRRARRTVIDALLAADRPDLVDTAALVTSEIVTNAVLHAGSDIWVTITITAAGALVEVEDHSPHLPAPRSYDVGATTGRGMTLIEQLVTSFGVRLIPDDGKVVWFTLGAFVPPTTARPPKFAGSDATITLRGVPVALFCAFQQVADGLLREYVLARFRHHFQDYDLGDWNRASSAFAELARGGEIAFRHRDSGMASLDLAFDVAPRAASRFAAMARVLDSAVAMAAAGDILVPPSQPEILALRNWCCEQVKQQVEGMPPTPWESGRPVDVPAPSPIVWDTSDIARAQTAMLAADDANRLVAVSPAAAQLLGWTSGELVGQRIVAIVPHALRDAHIAGFVRYLVSGECRILGEPVQVNALRKDGSEVAVALVIEAMALDSGRTGFTATLTPTALGAGPAHPA